MGVLAPAFLAGFMAIAIPVVIHLIHRERRETIAFPSLMFLRKIPYRSIRRQKLRHLLLLALRCLAVAIVVAAFARPFLERKFAAAPAASDAREIVVLLDRSYSMAHGGRWARATTAASRLAAQLRPIDRMSLVTFAATAAQVVPPTSDAGRVDRVVATLRPGSEPTRYATGFRMAAQILGASELPRKEIILVSDFHRFGVTANDDVSLPTGTGVRTIDVSRREDADVAVASVAIARTRTADRVRAVITARAANFGSAEATVNATLELAGREAQSKRVTIPARSASQVVFSGAPVATRAVRGVVRITADSQPSNDAFYFVVAEEAGASALVVEPRSPRANQSLFLSRALAVADDPTVDVNVKQGDIAPADLRGRSLIVLNETDLPTGALGAELRERVNAGAMLLVIPGERATTAAAEWRAVLPASIGATVDRATDGRWASVDFSNALFEPFRTARADFSSVRVTRYRSVTASDSAQIIARLDDGAPLLVERRVGAGRILIWTASLDPRWTDLPFHPLFVPLTHQLARRSLAGNESRSWFTVPHVLDLSRETNVIVESPGGDRIRVSRDSQPRSVELRDRGFYEVRASATAIGAGRPIAANVDLAESDLSHADPAELVAAITARGERGATPSSGTPFTGTNEELEQRQAIWWYLLLAALLVLAGETLFSNRLSRRSLEQQITGAS